MRSGGSASSANTGATTGNINLSIWGDQIFAGTAAFPTSGDTGKPGATYEGTLLAGLDFSGNNTSWDSDATNWRTSALPDELSDGLSNIALENRWFGRQYIGPRSGLTASELKRLIDDPANWSGGRFGGLGSTDFTIAVPEPNLPSCMAFFLGLFAVRRYRHRLLAMAAKLVRRMENTPYPGFRPDQAGDH